MEDFVKSMTIKLNQIVLVILFTTYATGIQVECPNKFYYDTVVQRCEDCWTICGDVILQEISSSCRDLCPNFIRPEVAKQVSNDTDGKPVSAGLIVGVIVIVAFVLGVLFAIVKRRDIQKRCGRQTLARETVNDEVELVELPPKGLPKVSVVKETIPRQGIRERSDQPLIDNRQGFGARSYLQVYQIHTQPESAPNSLSQTEEGVNRTVCQNPTTDVAMVHAQPQSAHSSLPAQSHGHCQNAYTSQQNVSMENEDFVQHHTRTRSRSNTIEVPDILGVCPQLPSRATASQVVPGPVDHHAVYRVDATVGVLESNGQLNQRHKHMLIPRTADADQTRAKIVE